MDTISKIVAPACRARSRCSQFALATVATALLGAAGVASAAEAEAASGPTWADVEQGQGALPGLLRLHDGFLLHHAFLLPTPPPTRLLAAGRSQIDFEFAVANTFTRSNNVQVALETRPARGPVDEAFFQQVAAQAAEPEPLFLLDGEVQRAELRLRRGFAKGLEAELTLPVLNVVGGDIDGLAEGFHSLLGIDQDGRQNVSRSSYLAYLELPRGLVLRDRAPGASIGDPVVTMRRAFRATMRRGKRKMEPRRTFLVEGSIKLPVGDEMALLSSGSVDVGVQGTATVCGWYFCAYGGVGVRRLGAWGALGIGDQVLVDGVTAIERRYPGSVSLIYQISAAQSALTELGLANLAEDSYRFTLGYKRGFGRQRGLTLAVTENFAHFDNGADITFHIGWTQGLGGGSLSGGD